MSTGKEREESVATEKKHFNTQERDAERGDAAAPDAPARADTNEGMSTILDSSPADGVQNNASEE